MKRSSVECGFECRVQQSTEKVGEVRETRNTYVRIQNKI